MLVNKNANVSSHALTKVKRFDLENILVNVNIK